MRMMIARRRRSWTVVAPPAQRLGGGVGQTPRIDLERGRPVYREKKTPGAVPEVPASPERGRVGWAGASATDRASRPPDRQSSIGRASGATARRAGISISAAAFEAVRRCPSRGVRDRHGSLSSRERPVAGSVGGTSRADRAEMPRRAPFEIWGVDQRWPFRFAMALPAPFRTLPEFHQKVGAARPAVVCSSISRCIGWCRLSRSIISLVRARRNCGTERPSGRDPWSTPGFCPAQ